MIVLAKALQAIAISCVMIGLVQGIHSGDMWIELYLFIAGIVLFLIGRAVEKRAAKQTP